MRTQVFLAIFGLMLLFSLFGCTGQGGAQNATTGGAANQTGAGGQNLSPDDRHFIYDLGNPSSPAVAKTIAQTVNVQEDAHNVYGTVNLTVRNCLDLEDKYYQSLCLQKAALYLKDVTLCNKTSAAYEPYCYYEFAGEMGNASVCDLIESSAEQTASTQAMCKRRVAISTGDSSLCSYSPNEINGANKSSVCKAIADSGKLVGKERCNEDIVYNVLVESQYFSDTISWLSQNHTGETVLSWWDYGTPLECMGLNSVISEDDLNSSAVPEVAHLLVASNESELAAYMKSKGAKYLMLDFELISSGGTLGGKYGALNYLSCVWSNETSADAGVGESQCESSHLWETIFITSELCNASTTETGYMAYKMYSGSQYLTNYPSSCISPRDQRTKDYCDLYFHAVPAYCVAETTLESGETAYAPHFLDQHYSDGSLKLDKALTGLTYKLSGTWHFGDVTAATLFYTHDKVWPGGLEGYDDHTSPFYESVIYKGLFLGSLEGFKKVYTDPTGSVTVFELTD